MFPKKVRNRGALLYNQFVLPSSQSCLHMYQVGTHHIVGTTNNVVGKLIGGKLYRIYHKSSEKIHYVVLTIHSFA